MFLSYAGRPLLCLVTPRAAGTNLLFFLLLLPWRVSLEVRHGVCGSKSDYPQTLIWITGKVGCESRQPLSRRSMASISGLVPLAGNCVCSGAVFSFTVLLQITSLREKCSGVALQVISFVNLLKFELLQYSNISYREIAFSHIEEPEVDSFSDFTQIYP